MISLGEKLRTEREKKGLSLSDVAVQTRISSRFLSAMEADDPSSMPGSFFYKSFVQQYARFLGLELTEYQSALDTVFSTEDSSLVPVAQAGRSGPELGSIAPEGMHRSYRRIWISGGLLVAVVIGCSGLYMLWERIDRSRTAGGSAPPSTSAPNLAPSPPVTAQSIPPVTAPASNPPAAAASEPPTTVPQSEPSAKPPEPAPTPAPAKLEPAPARTADASGDLSISANDKAWISVQSNGKTIFIGVLEAGESKTLQAGGETKMRVGNAGAVQVTWHGKPVGPLGPKGQIRVVTMTGDRVDIQNPLKKPAEADSGGTKM